MNTITITITIKKPAQGRCVTVVDVQVTNMTLATTRISIQISILIVLLSGKKVFRVKPGRSKDMVNYLPKKILKGID
jgi:hypothetical protein